jgi:hypothetical protein
VREVKQWGHGGGGVLTQWCLHLGTSTTVDDSRAARQGRGQSKLVERSAADRLASNCWQVICICGAGSGEPKKRAVAA